MTKKHIIMNNEEEVVDNKAEETETVEETKTEQGEESHADERKNEDLEAKYARLKRQAEQLGKKLGIEAETKKTSKTDTFDYGQKAFLVANGIKGESEMSLARNVMKETGKTLEQVLESKYFQAELKEMRDLQNTANATPSGKRSGSAATDNVDYWIAKGELPPAHEVELRRAVVNARLKKSTNKGIFYNS